jgi:hypothetical protein
VNIIRENIVIDVCALVGYNKNKENKLFATERKAYFSIALFSTSVVVVVVIVVIVVVIVVVVYFILFCEEIVI